MKKHVNKVDWSTLEFSADPEEVDYTVFSHALPGQKWELLGEGEQENHYWVRVTDEKGQVYVEEMSRTDLMLVPLGIIRKEMWRLELRPENRNDLRNLY